MLQVRQVVRGEKKFEKHCLSTCVDIFNIVSDDADCIVGVHRIGKQGEKRSRLLKVKCKDSESRNRVLRHAKELRKNIKYKNVFINPDRTPLEQRLFKALLQELRERKDSNENVVIFHDRIVNRREIKNF